MKDEFDTLRGARLDGLRWVPGDAVQARRRAIARSAIAAGVLAITLIALAIARAAL